MSLLFKILALQKVSTVVSGEKYIETHVNTFGAAVTAEEVKSGISFYDQIKHFLSVWKFIHHKLSQSMTCVLEYAIIKVKK